MEDADKKVTVLSLVNPGSRGGGGGYRDNKFYLCFLNTF